MSRIVQAAALSDALVKDARTITATGAIVGCWTTTSGTCVILHLPPGATVEIHPA